MALVIFSTAWGPTPVRESTLAPSRTLPVRAPAMLGGLLVAAARKVALLGMLLAGMSGCRATLKTLRVRASGPTVSSSSGRTAGQERGGGRRGEEEVEGRQ